MVCTELVWRSYRPATDKQGLHIELVNIAGRQTLPAQEFAKLFAAEHGRSDAQLDFVAFLDAREEAAKTVTATEEDFLETIDRSKWSFFRIKRLSETA